MAGTFGDFDYHVSYTTTSGSTEDFTGGNPEKYFTFETPNDRQPVYHKPRKEFESLEEVLEHSTNPLDKISLKLKMARKSASNLSPKTIAYLKSLFLETFNTDLKLHIYPDGNWEIVKLIEENNDKFEQVVKEGQYFQMLLDYMIAYSTKRTMTNYEVEEARAVINRKE